MKIKELTPETSYITDPVSTRMSGDMLSLIEDKYKKSKRKRHRFCFHQNQGVLLHDIIICYDSTTYIPPNKHIGKAESLLVLQGELDFYLFNENGDVTEYKRLAAISESKPFYVRVPPNTWHGLKAVGKTPCIIKETISGPYEANSLLWASFAPKESEGAEKGFDWYESLKIREISNGNEEVFEELNNGVFRSSRQLVTVSKKQLEPIIEVAKSLPIKRARLCCHTSANDDLQEMFIVLMQDVEISESYHIRKDESLVMLDGKGHYIFPNEDTTIREKINLSSKALKERTNEIFFARINRYVPHKVIVSSEFMLIHEATTGPFVKNDTDYRLKGIS